MIFFSSKKKNQEKIFQKKRNNDNTKKLTTFERQKPLKMALKTNYNSHSKFLEKNLLCF